MNPRDFEWKEDQSITVVNPTKDDFKFKVHSKDYMVAAGQTAKMPGYMAWMYVYKLATQMAIKDKQFLHWNEEGFRQKYYDKLVIAADDVIQTVKPEPQVEDLSQVKPMDTKNGKPSGN